MNEAEIPIDIHTLKLQDWLISRRIVPKNIQVQLKEVRSKITNALKDMPEHERLVKLLTGTNINYFHCKEIVEILKHTEKDTKSVFGTYGSQRMKDWQEVMRLYEKEQIYLAEAAQIYVRNINYEIPAIKKQMIKLEQQSDECVKRVHDLGKPEAQLLAEHATLLQQIGVKGENLQSEFLDILNILPKLYEDSIKSIGSISEAIKLYGECSGDNECLPILRHLIEFGNTTVYQFIHKETPLAIEEPPAKVNLSVGLSDADNDNNGEANLEIDFGDSENNGNGTSSTISAEMIDFGSFSLDSDAVDLGTNGSGDGDASNADIDWGIGNSPMDGVEVNFDIPIEEYGIVVESVGMDGGTAKGDQAFTILDSPNYRDRFVDELYELEAFLQMRLYELNQMDVASNIMFSFMDNISTHDAESIRKLLKNVQDILVETQRDQTRHLFQLKHSAKYADLLATKLKQMFNAVEKIRATKENLKLRSTELKKQRQDLNPVLAELTAQTKQLQAQIEDDISKRYKNRVVNLIGGVF